MNETEEKSKYINSLLVQIEELKEEISRLKPKDKSDIAELKIKLHNRMWSISESFGPKYGNVKLTKADVMDYLNCSSAIYSKVMRGLYNENKLFEAEGMSNHTVVRPNYNGI